MAFTLHIEAKIYQGEFEGVLPEDLRRKTETQTKFGAQFWRRIISNKIWRMILVQHLTT